MDLPVAQRLTSSYTARADEEGHARRGAHMPAAQRSVGCQRADHARVQRHQTRLAELGSPDREKIFGPIDISDAEVERLTESETCDCQQPKQAVIGSGAQWVS